MSGRAACCDELLLASGALLAEVEKARGPSVATTQWLVETEVDLAAAILAALRRSGRGVLDAARTLIRGWTVGQSIQALAAALGRELDRVGPAAEKPVEALLGGKLLRAYRRVKAETVRRHRFRPSAAKFGPRDDAAVKFLARTNAFFVRDASLRVSASLSRRAQEILTVGIQEGLGPVELRDRLTEQVAGFVDRPAYARVVAANAAGRARTTASVLTYRDAGVERYQWLSVLDERTTEICFAPWTLIALADGTEAPIAEVVLGTLLRGRGERPGRVVHTTVRATRDWVRVSMDNGREVLATGNHPFHVEGAGWQQARELESGQRLRGLAGPVSVEAVEARDHEAAAYNLEVEDDPVYFAEGALVHNCRFLDGREFSVRASVRTLDRAEEASETALGDMRFVTPFLRDRVDPETGERELAYERRDGSFARAARVLQPSTGERDAKGQYLATLDDRGLAQAGIVMPPAHHNCRSTVVPL